MLPSWTLLPFPALVLAMAVLPALSPHRWEKRWFQALVVACCALPILASTLLVGETPALLHTARSYATFTATLGALYVTAGGIYAMGDLEATPATNVGFLLVGSLLASAIGTTGASMLVIRPLLRTNSQREHTAHLVPFFILAVANAGGLLTPLGDPPLLVGFADGVPFAWTLRLFPIWVLYVSTFALGLYVVDRRAYARESPESIRRDERERRPLEVRGLLNIAFLLAIVAAAFLPAGLREASMLGIAVLSYKLTPPSVHEQNQFSFGPILEIALLFAGLFLCLIPIEAALAENASALPLSRAWHLFWSAGAFSAVLDNAPTYAAFAALARGLSAGQPELVAGIAPLKLAAISAGSVVMGATTYIGNGPNLMVKAIAERAGMRLPSFGRFFVFALVAMLPAHLIVSVAFAWLER
ncbi:MAG TPA: sodium:proton antiporter [Polyangiaceae bacterium]|nr:sodium:proton antiporter [Polyangiaceae bacterium]